MHKQESARKWDAKNSLGFWYHWIMARRPDLVLTKNELRTYRHVGFDHTVKIKESEKLNKYLDFAKERRKQWNMLMTVIPKVVGALGTISECLVKKSKKSWKSEGSALLRSAWLLRRVLETWGDLLLPKQQWKTTS